MSAKVSKPIAPNPVARLVRVATPHHARLLLGVVIAELAVWAGLLLSAQTGRRLAGAALGILAATLLLKLAGASRIVLRYAERLRTHDAMFRAIADLRVWFYRRMARGAGAGLGFRRSGDLLSRLVSDVQSLDNLYLRIAVPLATALLTVPLVAVAWLKAGIAAGLAALAVFLLLAVVLPWRARALSLRSGPHLLRARAALRVASLDLATGLREARAFGAEDVLTAALARRQEALFALERAQARRMAAAQALAAGLGWLGVGLLLCAVAGVLFHRAPPVAGIAALLVAVTAFDGVTGLSRAGLLYGEALGAAERITEVTDRKPPVPEGTLPAPEGHEIGLDSVTFGWPGRPPVFRDLTLTLREGERIALIGPSGAGKSSLAALMLKAAAPQKGRVLFGGAEISAIRDDELRTRIAWLSQSSHLFDDTVRGNLLLGRTGVPDAALWDALERAQVADVVRALPEGLDCWIGESGSRLSGGQGRRVALARALLSDAPVLILDEPATGLDADTERGFLETLNAVAEGRTVLLIAHRLTGVERLDRVLRLEDGRVTSVAG